MFTLHYACIYDYFALATRGRHFIFIVLPSGCRSFSARPGSHGFLQIRYFLFFRQIVFAITPARSAARAARQARAAEVGAARARASAARVAAKVIMA